jgi:hypothetical protein
MFLNFHENHKLDLKDKYNLRNYNSDYLKPENRQGSYWESQNLLNKRSRTLRKSFDSPKHNDHDLEFNNQMLESAYSNMIREESKENSHYN